MQEMDDDTREQRDTIARVTEPKMAAGNDEAMGTVADRPEVVRQVRDALTRLDMAMTAVADVRPEQVHYWRKRSKGALWAVTEPGGLETAQLMSLLGDLRRLLQEARVVAREELGIENPDW